jgi:hypothetical protein
LEDYTSLNAMQAQGMSLNYANPQLESAVYKEEPSQSRFSVLHAINLTRLEYRGIFCSCIP